MLTLYIWVWLAIQYCRPIILDELNTDIFPNFTHGAQRSFDNAPANATYLSSVYNKIMKDYDKKFRPNFGSNATLIKLDMQILSFPNIDEQSMEFSVEFYFLQIWQDPRFEVLEYNEEASISIIGNEIDKLWLPDTVFVNSKSSKFHHITVNNRFLLADFKTGEIAYHSRISTQASCLLDLRDYPFDVQHCFLAIESYGYPKSELEFTWWNESLTPFPNVQIYIKEMSNYKVIEATKTKNRTSYNHGDFSCATINLSFKRISSYFIVQVYLPSMLIVMVTWSTFWISPTAVPARSSICVTAILTLITMLGIVNANMPKVSYVKALDLYLFVCFVFVFLSLLEFIIVINVKISYRFHMVSKESQEKCAEVLFRRSSSFRTYNRNTRNSMKHRGPLLSFQGNTNNFPTASEILKPPPIWQRRCGKRKYAYSSDTIIDIEDNVNNKNNQNGKQNDVRFSDDVSTLTADNTSKTSSIDVASRLLFPLSFACFNLGYWLSYLSLQEGVNG